MALAQTFTSNQVTYNGFTWTFQQPVEWGYFVNGDPFVIAPQGQSVALTGIEPTPRFIPASQITVNVSGTETPVTSLPWYPTNQTTGLTSPPMGLVTNHVTNEVGLYINGSQLNPVRYGIYPQDSAAETLPNLQEGAFYTVDSRWQTGLVSSTLRINKPDLHAWTNLAAAPKSLVSGDMLMSFDCPFANNQPEGSYAQRNITISSLSVTRHSRFNKQAILTIIPNVPDENDFRPPLYWGDLLEGIPTASPKTRPIGRFNLSSVAATKQNITFINLPTKDIHGRTMADANNNPITLNENSISVYNQNTMNNVLAWRYSPSMGWCRNTDIKFCTTPFENMWGGQGPFNSTQFNSIFVYHGGACNLLMEPLMSAKAIGMFCSFLTEEARRKCMIQTIQYGIDMFGAARAEFFDTRCGSGTRAAIILAGWLLGDQEMINVDDMYPDFLQTHYGAALQTENRWYKRVGSVRDLTARMRFAEAFSARRLAGTWGDPSLSSVPDGYKYTDPGTTADLGIGWAYKNTGDDGLGIRVATAGLSTNSVGIAATGLMGGNRIHSTEHAVLGITLYAGSVGEPYAFPKTASTNTSTAARYGSRIPSITGLAPRDQSWKNVKMRVISGAGASDTVYRVVNVSSNIYQASVVPSTWSGLIAASFSLDKAWTNGTPDSTSRVIFYPFDSSDIGMSATKWFGEPTTAQTSYANREADLGVVSPSSLYNTVTSGVDSNTPVVGLINLLRYYGILYAIGTRYENSRLLDNQITQQVCDSLIFSLFSNEPFGLCIMGQQGNSNSDVNPNTHSFFSHAAPYVRELGVMPGLGGIVSQLWNRTIPR